MLFAGNTNLFISDKDIKKLCDNVNQELCKAAYWLAVNKLSINVKKTHFVIFKAKNKNLTNNISINIVNQNIEQVNNTNFLGLNIDQDLSFVSFLFFALKIMICVFFTWKHHIKVPSRIAKLLGIMIRASH